MLAVQLYCARHCELPLSKMGNKGLFPGVAVPLAFFCTLFFRHRKKSVSAPWDGQSQSAPELARQAPPKGNFLRQSCCLMLLAGGFPRGKQSARFALPCGPLTVCLHLRGPHSALSLPPTPKPAVRTNVRTAWFWEPRMPVRGHSTKFSCRLPAALAEVSVAQTRRGLILPLFAQTGQNQNNDRDQIGERFENLLHAPI